MTRGWWRDNRFWLPALPLALAMLLLASSYNVKDFWYDAGLHHRVASGQQGEQVSATMRYDDAVGATSRTFEVRMTELGTTDTYPFKDEDEPQPPPNGIDAVVAHLDWAAESDQVLTACTVSLVDDQGRRYDVDTTTVFDSCVPEDRPGPTDPFSKDGERGLVVEGEERPATWSTAPVFLVPHGRKISQVLVWWPQSMPDYVELSVS
jgi:hypothetical protein